MKTIDHCSCGRTHRTERAFMQCAMPSPKPIWIAGSGSYALIAWCGEDWYPPRGRKSRVIRKGTVMLYATEAESIEAKEHLGRSCGHRCHGDHEVVRVVMGQ